MDNFWIAIYMIIAIMVVFLMPTAIYVYESDDEKPMVLDFSINGGNYFCKSVQGFAMRFSWKFVH